MKKIITIIIFCLITVFNTAQANETRMQTLMAGDYLDDLINIGIYPQHMVLYDNNFYGDIKNEAKEDYGIIITPDIKYGTLAFWQAALIGDRFNIGYAIKLFKFDLGAYVSPIKDRFQFGLGVGRACFAHRIDLSFIANDEPDNEWYQFNIRFSKRKLDFIIIPKYKLNYSREPYEYSDHRIGLMLQHLILNEGFVFFGAEYELSRGDIESDHTNIFTGFELPLTKIVVLRLGVHEQFSDGFETPTWAIEPGIGLQIRGFSLDFQLNKQTLYSENENLLKSFGLDLNFGRF